MTSTPPTQQTATLAAMLEAAKRKRPEFALRRTFVQQGTQRNPEPGPLKKLVEHHDETALDLYLLFRAAASGGDWDVTRDARVWGRALGHGDTRDGGASVVSKAWRRLDENYGLVTRERSGKLARITALDDSGNRAPFTYPTGAYFKFPFAYWTAPQEWHRTLTLRAKACMLIALSLQAGFVLPAERGPRWYGISADTIDRGLRELRDHDLLSRRFVTLDNPLSPTGHITEFHYTVKQPFRRRRVTPATRGHLTAVGAP